MTTLTRARIPVCLGPDIGLVGDIDGLASRRHQHRRWPHISHRSERRPTRRGRP